MNQNPILERYLAGRKGPGMRGLLKIPIVALAGLLWPEEARAATDMRPVLLQKLAEYCIPSQATQCNPGTYSMATYDDAAASANKCRCLCADMRYDAAARKCEPCEDGADEYATECKTISCPAGFYKHSAESCPSGFYAVGSSSWSCAGVSEASCGAGFYKTTY